MPKRKDPGALTKREITARTVSKLIFDLSQDTEKLTEAVLASTDRQLGPTELKDRVEQVMKELDKFYSHMQLVLQSRGLRNI